MGAGGVNRIIWKKWQCPLTPLVEAKDEDGDEDGDEDELYSAMQSFGFTNTDVSNEKPLPWRGPAFYGPHGIVPVHEGNVPSRLYNFWMGHTNFDLNDSTEKGRWFKRIADVPGVESFNAYTRYRFRVGIGMAFNDVAVRGEIDRLVSFPPPSDDPFDQVKRAMATAFAFWAVIRRPRGKFEFVGGATKEEVKAKVKASSGATESVVLSWE